MHSMDTDYFCRRSGVVCRCVCGLVATGSPAKTDGPICMLVGADSGGSRNNVSDGVLDLTWKGHL